MRFIHLIRGLLGVGAAILLIYLCYWDLRFQFLGKEGTATVISFVEEATRGGRRSKRQVYVHTVKWDIHVTHQDLSQRYPPGTQLTVTYIPNTSEMRVARKDDSWSSIIMLLVGAAVAYYGIDELRIFRRAGKTKANNDRSS